MKNSLLIIIFIACFQTEINAQTVFELDGTQSMLMTGKGPGQDATINAYEGEDCYAVIKNLGDVLFSVRIQQKGQIIDIFSIESNHTIKYKLLVGQELYLDAESKNIAKARIDYEKINQKFP